MSKHTPPPWYLKRNRWKETVISTKPSEREGAVITEIRGGYGTSPEQQKANPHLLVAAPDLYAVAEALISLETERLNAGTDDWWMASFLRVVMDARMAVRKADGETA